MTVARLRAGRRERAHARRAVRGCEARRSSGTGLASLAGCGRCGGSGGPSCDLWSMPEGDTIHHAAARIRAVLEGQVPEEILTPQPRHASTAGPSGSPGARCASVDAHGKHLFLRFEGGLTLHSHLRMSGAWASSGGRALAALAQPRVAGDARGRTGRSCSSTARCSS